VSSPNAEDELLRKASAARGDEYRDLTERAIRAYELSFEQSPCNGFKASFALGLLAETRSPREATRLRRKGLEWVQRFPAGQLMKAMEARQVAEAYRHLARFRTGPPADALFAGAEQPLASASSDGLGTLLLSQWADLLCEWAWQERNSQADAIFGRAQQKFAEVQRRDPKNKEYLLRYCEALRQRAEALSGDRALEMLARAKAAAEELISDEPTDARVWQFLAQVAILEAQKRAGSGGDWSATADRCFEEALRLRPRAAGAILCNHAAALGLFAMDRSGEEALELYRRADEKFRESETLKPESRALRKNWSSILLREARARGGSPELFERAMEQAEKANAIDPGSGAYNLACIGVELGNRQAVERWLVLSAEFGQIMSLSHILRDVEFEAIQGEPWFRILLESIFDAGLPTAPA
jgi:hypothetical protein